MSIEFIISLIGFAPIIFITIGQMNKFNKKYDYVTTSYSGIMFGFLLYYSVIPILTMANIDNIGRLSSYYKYVPHIVNKSVLDYIFAICMVYLALFCIITSYNKTVSRLYHKVQQNKMVIKENDRVYHLVKRVGIITLVIGSASLVVLIISLGGLGAAFVAAESIRQHNVNLSELTNVYFLYVSAGLVEVAPYFFYFAYSKKKSINNLILMLLSIIFVVIYFIFQAGKSPILGFLVTFIYLFIKKFVKQKNYTWRMLVPLGILAIPSLSIMDAFFHWMNTGRMPAIDLNYYNQLGGFAAPFTLILNMSGIVMEYGVTWFLNIPQDFLSILPKVDFPASYENTSEYISGLYWKNTGGIPNDLITYGYIQLGIIGVIVVCWFVGYLIAKLDLVLMSIDDVEIRLLFGIVLAVNFWGITAGADLRPILQGGFTLLCVIAILAIVDAKYTNISKRIKFKF